MFGVGFRYRAGERISMDVLFQNILEQGFPVVISVYLLVRLEGKLDLLEKTINDLKIEISKMSMK